MEQAQKVPAHNLQCLRGIPALKSLCVHAVKPAEHGQSLNPSTQCALLLQCTLLHLGKALFGRTRCSHSTGLAVAVATAKIFAVQSDLLLQRKAGKAIPNCCPIHSTWDFPELCKKDSVDACVQPPSSSSSALSSSDPNDSRVRCSTWHPQAANMRLT
jgi:hypothetical protein